MKTFKNYKDWLIVAVVGLVVLTGLWTVADNYRTLFRYLLDGELYIGAGMLTLTLIITVLAVGYLVTDVVKSWFRK